MTSLGTSREVRGVLSWEYEFSNGSRQVKPSLYQRLDLVRLMVGLQQRTTT